jgi:transcription elongation factor Elf1
MVLAFHSEDVLYPENYTIEHNNKKMTYQCMECGKSYKHRNCLSKHVWEHSEEWELASSFLLTKHQQVQMLEAAAILMTIDKHSHYSPTIKKRKLSTEEEEKSSEEDDIHIDMDDL